MRKARFNSPTPLPTFPGRSNYDLKSLDTYFIMWVI